ncbi:MAG: hypothetical protein IPG96_06990 [Proteobacteria bacterium]|nr:hypothetical protein [Pseudomonadota bacterium]
MLQLRRLIAGFALLLALPAATLAPSGCALDDCARPAACCASCEATRVRRASCACAPDEVSALECPKRSACALSHYVGDHAAACCRGSCASAESYEEASGRCPEQDAYLHECTVESACFQAYRARLLGTLYLPWQAEASGSGTPLTAIWAPSEGEAWAVGLQGRVLRLGAGAWQAIEVPTTEHLTAVWGSAADDVWAVGWNGTLLHFDGERWLLHPTPTTAHLLGVWGRSATEIWAVGAAGTLLRFGGAVWEAQPLPTQALLTTVRGGPTGDLWVAGEGGTVLRGDGEQWVLEPTPLRVPLTALWTGKGGDEVWAVGRSATLLRRQEGGWQRVEGPLPGLVADLAAVWGDGAATWAVGDQGVVLRHDGARWQLVTYFAGAAPVDLLGLWGVGRRLWAVGTGGTILRYDSP